MTAPQAHNVTNDQVAYGRLGAEWLFKKLGGKGNVVEMRGIAGVPADTDRHTGFQQALKKYPGIKVVKQTFTNWAFAPGGKQMLDILNSGVQGRRRLDVRHRLHGRERVQDGRQAVRADRRRGQQRVPAAAARRVKGLSGAAVTNPATIGGAGAAVAIKLLQGKKVQNWVKLTPQVVGQRHRGGQERDQGELLAEPCADVQRPAADQAVDDLHHQAAVGCKGP